MFTKKLTLSALLAAATLGISSSAASAAIVSFSFTGAGANADKAAQVTFDLTGTTLKVTLANTSTTAVNENADHIMAVFWHSNSAIGGTFTNVDLGAGASKYWPNGSAGTPTDASEGGFSYVNNLAANFGGALTNQQYGLSGAGFGIPYTTSNLALDGSSQQIDGPDGGIAPLVGGSAANGNKPAIKGSLDFYITNVSPTFSLTDISNVRFQYGTGLDEFSAPPTTSSTPPAVPLPAAAWSGMALLAGLGVAGKLRKRSA